ncbi:MAG: hypothetical protein IMY70_04355 [Bacteroidetes bacterium]|nr:hypothetical protein [Bacteroidota bacterium]
MTEIAYKQQSDWKIIPERKGKEKKIYSGDDVIDAYLKGKKDQKNSDTQVFIDKLKDNLNLAKSISEKLYSIIINHGFKCKIVKLKIKDIYTYTSLFIIDEDDFCKDDFLKIYKESIKIKKEVNTSKTFNYNTMFSPDNRELSDNCVSIDGFYLSYVLQ